MAPAANRACRFLLLAGAVLLSGAAQVSAATIVWANTTADIGLAASWTGGTRPGAGDIGSFQSTSPANPTLSTSFALGGLEFTSGAGAYTFNLAAGTQFGLTVGGSGILNNSAALQTFSGARLSLTFSANATITNNGLMLFSQTGTTPMSIGANTLTLSGTGGGTISAVISGTGGIVQAGAGTWSLSGVNTFTGGTTVSAGTLALGVANALPAAGSLTVSGGAFSMLTRSFTQANVSLLGGTLSSTTGVLTVSSAISVQSGSASAILAGAAALTKSTSGTVTLSGANTFTGTATVAQGILNLASAAALGATAAGTTVSDGATLGLVSATGITVAEPLTL
jgi:autotransporter-associated beta strand protein